MKFRKRPITIDAWTVAGLLSDFEHNGGFFDEEIANAHRDGVIVLEPPHKPRQIEIHTLEGTMVADPTDFLIRGINGEFYPCKPGIFAASYEAA